MNEIVAANRRGLASCTFGVPAVFTGFSLPPRRPWPRTGGGHGGPRGRAPSWHPPARAAAARRALKFARPPPRRSGLPQPAQPAKPAQPAQPAQPAGRWARGAGQFGSARGRRGTRAQRPGGTPPRTPWWRCGECHATPRKFRARPRAGGARCARAGAGAGGEGPEGARAAGSAPRALRGPELAPPPAAPKPRNGGEGFLLLESLGVLLQLRGSLAITYCLAQGWLLPCA